MVVCAEPEWLDACEDVLLNPIVIIELLSPSTERNDRGAKFAAYRGIECLRQYLMLGSQRISAELYTMQLDGKWLLSFTDCLEDAIPLESISCQLSMSRLYRRLDFQR